MKEKGRRKKKEKEKKGTFTSTQLLLTQTSITPEIFSTLTPNIFNHQAHLVYLKNKSSIHIHTDPMRYSCLYPCMWFYLTANKIQNSQHRLFPHGILCLSHTGLFLSLSLSPNPLLPTPQLSLRYVLCCE